MSDFLYTVSSSPHVRDKSSIRNIMLDVIIALIPATLFGIYNFGLYTILIIALSIGTCVLSEYAWQKVTKKRITIYDLSAVVTGLLLALNLPPSVPFWIPILGGVFAIIIVKQFFGGLGQNFMNPALAARVFLMVSYSKIMTTWELDGITTATPLQILKEGGDALPSFSNVFIGNIGGCIGETSAIALILGGGYLLYKKVINYRIPVFYIGTVFILTLVLGRGAMFSSDPVYEIFAGGLMIGAFFMATDYSSSPMSHTGQIIMGIGCGIITVVIRLYGGYPEGVSYAIILMNLAVPIIDRYTKPRVFGGAK